MIIAGLLTTMNVWVNKYQDIRLSLNDLYMTLLMTGWMFLFMGIYDKKITVFLFGLLLVIINFTFIRTQFMISQSQYILGMVPHHSMAIHMSKKLLQKNNNIQPFLQKIITNQQDEINYMNYTSTLK
jgi:hypothetical protein